MIQWKRDEFGRTVSSCGRFTAYKRTGTKQNPWCMSSHGIILKLQWGDSFFVSGETLAEMKAIAERTAKFYDGK